MRSRLAALAVAVAAVTGLAACAPGGSGPAEPKDSSGPVKLTWWDYYQPGTTSSDALNALITKYENSHRNVTIDRQYVAYDDLKKTLLQSAGASSLPDIVIINSPDHQQFAETGIAADLTKQVKDWGQLSKYPKGVIASASYKGKIYGLPITANCLALFYDKKALADAGLKPPTTWDELKEDAANLTTGTRHGLAFSAINNQQAVFQWLPTLWQAGGDLTKLSSSNSVRALDFWASLVKDGSVSKEALNWDQTAVEVEFAQGRAAMMVNGPWQIPTLAKDAPNLDYGVALLPKDKTSASALGGENYLITDGPHERASWDLVKWLQSAKNIEFLAKGTGSLPTRTDAKPFSDSDAIATFTKQLQVARPRAYGANYAEIADAVVIALQSTLSGTSSAKDALDKAAAAVKPLLP
jgi:multiple sugar transport system substrate-binding protein